MRLKLFVAVTILVTASIAAFAQSHEPDNPAPPTIDDAQKLTQTISGDKAELKAFCELDNLYEQIEEAQERNDTEERDALGLKIDGLEQQIGPDYRRVIEGLEEVDPNSAEGQKLREVFEPLQEQFK
jgi:peptidoglycan hydrolase CwlO-like protein